MIAKKSSQEINMRYPSLCALIILCFVGPVLGGEADVVAVEVKRSGNQTYSFDVTVSHADQGWNHYANRWEIIAPDGEILAKRVLAHPHTNEQPFTRSLSGVKIPADIHQVTVRAHDSVHAYGGATKRIVLN
jgi:hypothetical protein